MLCRILILALLWPAIGPALQDAARRHFEDARQAYQRQDWDTASPRRQKRSRRIRG